MTAAVQVSASDIAARVQDLLPGIAERAAEGEESRRLPEKSAQVFLDAGLARILAPRRFGGYELGLDAWFDTVAAIGAVDAAHAWCASLIIHHPHYLAQFPLEAQEASYLAASARISSFWSRSMERVFLLQGGEDKCRDFNLGRVASDR